MFRSRRYEHLHDISVPVIDNRGSGVQLIKFTLNIRNDDGPIAILLKDNAKACCCYV